LRRVIWFLACLTAAIAGIVIPHARPSAGTMSAFELRIKAGYGQENLVSVR
jgi:hypothetical protein